MGLFSWAGWPRRTEIKEEPRCPFYGFFIAPGDAVLIAQFGNQCPLKNGYSPCHMDTSGKRPDWEKCSYSKNLGEKEQQNISIMKDKFTVITPGVKGSMRFGEWFDNVLKQE